MHIATRPTVALVLGVLVLAPAAPGYAYNACTHREMTAYAYELMTLADTAAVREVFAGNDEMTLFLAAAAAAAARLKGLPADLPPPHRGRCIDPEVVKRYATFSPIAAGGHERSVDGFPVPVDIKYMADDKSCGVDPYWRPGALYRQANPTDGTHAGNVLGFWSARPDDLLDDIRLQVRPTNTGGLSFVKQTIESAGGAALGTLWVPVKCLTKCGSSILKLDFDGCKACVLDAIDEAGGPVHDAVTTLDGVVPGVGEFKSDMIVGMSHHIDAKGDVAAPGWSPFPKRHYDDRSGLYSWTAGPFGQPGLLEKVAIAASTQLGVTVNYDKSDAPKNYQVNPGNDFHQNSRLRRRQDWEYLAWPHLPFTPLDNLAWYGWDRFRASVEATRANPANRIQTRYLGWALHGLGDATVPMHVTSTFAWGHRPYEDAVEELGRGGLGDGGDLGVELEQAAMLLRRALVYRKAILAWRAVHPERGRDVPIRDLVTLLATDTLAAAAAAQPGVYDDTLSSAYFAPLGRGASIQAYKLHAGFMHERMWDTVAASIAFLVSAMEILP